MAEAAVQQSRSGGPGAANSAGNVAAATGGPGNGDNTSAAPSPIPAATPSPPAATTAYRPSPVRSFTVSNPYLASVKGRATSQPPGGDRLPNSSPASGRGSPGMNSGEYGVIGGSRTPTSGRFSSSGGGMGVAPPVPVTRASSFSVADKLDQKPSSLVRALSSHLEERPSSRPASPSAFPTFSPSSSPSTSPSMGQNHLHPTGQYSPPVAPANVSRSRSQSMATGARPDRIMPLSTFEYSRFDESWQNDGSNMSPFTSGGRNFFDEENAPSRNKSAGIASSFRTPQETTFRTRAWGSPTTTALTTSVANALGSQPTYSSVVGGFDDAANGGRSGTSSRRHSVSVVGGPRRGFSYNESVVQGMSSMGGGRRGVGALGFTDDELLPDRFDNALNLSVDDSKRPDKDIASSLPVFSQTEASRSLRGNVPSTETLFGSSPAAEKQDRGRFGSFDTRSRASFSAAPTGGSPPERQNPVGAPVRAPPSAGLPPIGSVGYDNRFAGPASPGFRGPFNAPPPLGAPSAPGAAAFGRPPVNTGGFAYFGGGGPHPSPGRPQFPQNGAGFGGIGLGFGPSYPGAQVPPGPGLQPGGFGGQNFYATPPPAAAQASPSSFSSLSLADLGKGIPLASLPPTTPLYIVTFKAGRRDVFYCPDPTLLISNGDRVIVEADRGSDLGTVVFDQLTPVEVREWQERQATAALLSGASQHQPPGMAMTAAATSSSAPTPATPSHTRNGSQQQPRPPAPGALDFTGADLNTLLSGVGPSGSQMDMGGGGIGARGPLAKEIMPKRIFTKSSGGPEEQARMMEKLKEEYDAMMICREKVLQRGLPMQIVDAEYQWDRRKLTFYFKADKRVDFRELTKENFRIFKSRIWMSMVPKDDPRG